MRIFVLGFLALLAGCLSATAQYFNDHDSPPHFYRTAEMGDPMTLFLKDVEGGKKELPGESGKVLVEYLLKEMDVAPESQVMVFSKTSLQKGEISPGNPRALYFNEEVYIGWMPGGRVEIASFDPNLGPVFYFERPLDQEQGDRFARTRSCLGCHAGNTTNYMPGSLARSIYPGSTGRNLGSLRDGRLSGHEVPFAKRWGGWYVTGESGVLGHKGNRIAERGPQGLRFKPARRKNPKSLEGYFPVEKFSRPDSDVVALMVFDHQISMHQRLVEAGYRTRQSLHDNGLAEDDVDVSKLTAKVSRREFDEGVEKVVNYLLFRDEAGFDGEVSGSGEFEEVFLKERKKSRAGKSLKDFRLKGRLFEYRCSYMIYSKTFDRLPRVLREAVYGKLLEILTAEEVPEGFGYLEEGEKKEILRILRETKKDLPESWRVGV